MQTVQFSSLSAMTPRAAARRVLPLVGVLHRDRAGFSIVLNVMPRPLIDAGELGLLQAIRPPP